jgi:hypothetical protein
MRERLLLQIGNQSPDLLARCQVIVDIDGGAASIGAKRNRLLDAAVGRYVAFIDDDDCITENYLTRIFEGIEKNVDHVGVGMMFMPRWERPVLVECSVKHDWTFDGTKYLRPPQHVCAIKRTLALQVRFPEISFREDHAYAHAMKKLVKTEFVVTEPIYQYLFVENK